MIYILDPRDNENQFLYNFVSFDDDQNNGVQTGQWQIKDHEGIIQNVVRGSKRGSLDSGNEALTIQNQPKLIQTIYPSFGILICFPLDQRITDEG